MDPVSNNPGTAYLPDVFCWTKFGDEAGESAYSIFRRKEVERQRNGGVFLWGIGQSIRPSLVELLRVVTFPRVFFSPIRSAPASRDVSPAAVVIWCQGVGFDGQPYVLPEYSLVTSRRDASAARAYHFALVCDSETPITARRSDLPPLSLHGLRNLVSGSPLGSSQVTSVVRRDQAHDGAGAEYPIVAEARLVYPYLVRLTQGIVIPGTLGVDAASRATTEHAVGELLRLRLEATCEGMVIQAALPGM